MVSLPRPNPPLSNGTVALRAFELADVADVTAACQDREISRWTDAIPWPYGEDDARGWISRHEGLWERGEVAPFAIVGAEKGEFLGAISLVFPEEGPPEAAYWVAAWGRRRGVATAALTLVTHWGFESLGLESITLATMLGNVASERVAQNAGFTLVGETSEYRTHWHPERTYSVKQWECRNGDRQ
jgi:RimJ/RimL family protein N-acetyltransferase